MKANVTKIFIMSVSLFFSFLLFYLCLLHCCLYRSSHKYDTKKHEENLKQNVMHHYCCLERKIKYICLSIFILKCTYMSGGGLSTFLYMIVFQKWHFKFIINNERKEKKCAIKTLLLRKEVLIKNNAKYLLWQSNFFKSF